jgi:hypothetical protein
LEIASSPAGTVTTKVKAALSVGWSLRGNQLADPSGSLTTTAPSSVWINPASRVKSGPKLICWVRGTPSYRTMVVNRRPLCSLCLGVMVSSWSWLRAQRAFRPSTRTDRTVIPWKSRLNRQRFCVATAEIVATPTRRSVAGV